MGPCLGTHWEVDLDAGQALFSRDLDAGRGDGAPRAGLQSPPLPKRGAAQALPAPHTLPTVAPKLIAARRLGTARSCGVFAAGEGRRPGLLCPEERRQPRLGDTAQPLCGLQPHRPLSQQRPSGRAVGCAGGSVRWGWLAERTLTFLGSSPLQGAASGPHQSPGRPHPPFLTAEPSGLRSPRKARGCPAQSQPPTRLPGGCFPAVTLAGFYAPPAGAGLWG